MWVLTALVLVSIPVSVWVEPEILIQYEYPDTSQSVELRKLHLYDGRFIYLSNIAVGTANQLHQRHPNPIPNPGWRASVRHGFKGVGYWTGDGSWWLPKRYDFYGLVRWDMPLILPAVFMGVWCWWLIWTPVSSRRLKAGLCAGCGYSLAGLGGGVCPECGAGADDAAS